MHLDVRQSPKWSEYLKFYNWNSENICDNLIYRYIKLGFFSFAKVQRAKLLTSEDLVKIEELNKKSNSILIEIEGNIGQDTEILNKFGYKQSIAPNLPSKTFIVDLTKSEDELKKALSTSAKYSVNRSFREGDITKVFPSPNEKQVEEFYKMHKATGGKRGFSTQSFKDIKYKVKVFGNESYLINTYNKDGELMVSKLCVTYGDGVWYLLGAFSNEAQKTKSGYQNVWEAILFFKSKGFKYFDLEGAYDERVPKLAKEWVKFSSFKEKFGAPKVTFPLIHSKIALLNIFS